MSSSCIIHRGHSIKEEEKSPDCESNIRRHCSTLHDQSILIFFSLLDSLYVHCQNKRLNKYAFAGILKSLFDKARKVVSLNISFNPSLQDQCIHNLGGFLKSANNLCLLNLEKTGITHISGVHILKSLPAHNCITNLNFAANKLGNLFFDNLIECFTNKKFRSLKSLNLSNTGLGDIKAAQLFTAMFQFSGVERLNVSMNNLRYKSGSCLLTLINTSPNTLSYVDLTYTSISAFLVSQIEEAVQNSHQHNAILEDINMINIPNNISYIENSCEDFIAQDVGENKSSLATKRPSPYNIKQEGGRTVRSQTPNAFHIQRHANIEGDVNTSSITTTDRRQVQPVQEPKKDSYRTKQQHEENPLKCTATFENQGIPEENFVEQDKEKVLGTNWNYENIKKRIQSKKSIAQQVHPFYSKKTQEKSFVQSISKDTCENENLENTTADYEKATIEFLHSPAQDSQERMNQINKLVRASSKILKNKNDDERGSGKIEDSAKKIKTLEENDISENTALFILPENSIGNKTKKGTDTETLKFMLADQIQRLLKFYKELNLKDRTGSQQNSTLAEKLRNIEGTQSSIDNCSTHDKQTFLDRREFSLKSNGMIAGGYEDKIYNAMIENMCDSSSKGRLKIIN